LLRYSCANGVFACSARVRLREVAEEQRLWQTVGGGCGCGGCCGCHQTSLEGIVVRNDGREGLHASYRNIGRIRLETTGSGLTPSTERHLKLKKPEKLNILLVQSGSGYASTEYSGFDPTIFMNSPTSALKKQSPNR
jgi:hypothetical protein